MTTDWKSGYFSSGRHVFHLFLIASLMLVLSMNYDFFSPPRSADPILVNRLLGGHHFKSNRSRAHATQLRSLGWQERIANFLGLEDCIVADLTNGSPDYVFATLCYLEDYREILWVDDWPCYFGKRAER
jgi:hypothetical protein